MSLISFSLAVIFITRAIPQQGNQLSLNIRIYENNGIITDRFKQRVSLCLIGLVEEHVGHLVNQARLPLFETC